MDWVRTFYRQQTRWVHVYLDAVNDSHRTRAACVDQHDAETRIRRILELGCGGGQIAAAMADRGHDVVAIDLNPEALDHARTLAKQRPTMQVREGDFYTIDPEPPFDTVCYFDGFGIGSDAQQRQLLKRIKAWLVPDGEALIDIYTPWYWSHVSGRTMTFGKHQRQYGFEADTCTMLDHWWPLEDPESKVTQRLRCYTPADLRLLLEGTGLHLTEVIPGGAVDYAQGTYSPHVPLGQAMQFLARLHHTS